MKYQPKSVQYPCSSDEYRIVTPTGVIHCAYNDKKLALDRLRDCPDSWRLIQVTIHQVDITDMPRTEFRPTIVTCSAAKARAHRERGDNVTFIPLSQRA